MRNATWTRGFFMLLFAIAYTIGEIVVTVIVIFQFFATLVTGRVNERLLKLGQQLSTFLYQVLMFVTFNTEVRPYPFTAWPRGAPPQPKSAGKRVAARKQATNEGTDEATGEPREG